VQEFQDLSAFVRVVVIRRARRDVIDLDVLVG
jgi:hypothetical protein